MGIQIPLWGFAFNFCELLPQSGNAGLYANSCFYFWGTAILLSTVAATFRICQLRTKVLISLRPSKPWLFSFLGLFCFVYNSFPDGSEVFRSCLLGYLLGRCAICRVTGHLSSSHSHPQPPRESCTNHWEEPCHGFSTMFVWCLWESTDFSRIIEGSSWVSLLWTWTSPSHTHLNMAKMLFLSECHAAHN